MSSTTTPVPGPAVTTGTLAVPGARLHYELRGSGPLVGLVGAPMDARSFGPLADLLAADHTVLTLDPRGILRSPVEEDRDVTPDVRADDLSRLLAHLDAGPAVLLGSSGGAVDVLALAQARPDQVRAVIAHEPPLLELVEDADRLRAMTEDTIATYVAGDARGAFRKFLETADIHLPDEVFEAMAGSGRSEGDLADERFQYVHMLRGTTRWTPDVAALRAGPVRVVVGIGEDSAGQLCDRTSRALAAALGVAPTMFPGDHVGFADRPTEFADRLRAVLAGA